MSDKHENSPRLAREVRDGVLRLIAERHLAPGDKAPTEMETAELFDVARSTAREALQLLESDGIVEVQRGLGRFVTAAGALRIERPINRFESVTEMLRALGYEIKSAVLKVEETDPTEHEAAALALEPSARVIRVTRLRYSDERPLIFSVSTIPRECLPGPVLHRDWGSSVTEALAAHGHVITSSAARIRAANLPEDVEQQYTLSDLGPWLLIEETCVARNGQRVMYAEDYHRGTEIAFNVLRRR